MKTTDNLTPGDLITTSTGTVWFNFYELNDSGDETGYLICNDEEGDTVRVNISEVVSIKENTDTI